MLLFSCRPIVSTVEILTGLDPRTGSSLSTSISPVTRAIFSAITRIVVIVVMVIVSILFPDFDSIMALMGSALCFTICIVLPCAFYLKIYGAELSLGETVLNWVLIVVCSILAVVGTVWAVIPKSKWGIE